jgi:hypothetical protein
MGGKDVEHLAEALQLKKRIYHVQFIFVLVSQSLYVHICRELLIPYLWSVSVSFIALSLLPLNGSGLPLFPGGKIPQ